jgi:hypothetical protein
MAELVIIVSDNLGYYFEFFNESCSTEECDYNEYRFANSWTDLADLDVDTTTVLFYRCSNLFIREQWLAKQLRSIEEHGQTSGKDDRGSPA